MIVRRVYFGVVAAALVLALIIFGGVTLHKEWRNGYVVLGQSVPTGINLATYHLENAWEQVYRSLVSSREKGLEQVRLYIPEKNMSALLRDRPRNIKNWQRGFMIYPSGSLERIKVRHRGDNPINWGYGKKSWRIKTRKKRMLGGTRIFNYWSRLNPSRLEFYLANGVAEAAGILVPRTRVVEMFINDKSQGIYTEIEHLDESFLRNNRIMPVNLYKGEQDNVEMRVYVENNLFNNPALWSKTAVFNQLPDDNTDDLAFVLDLVRRAETSDTAYARLKRVARFSEWARFSAYQTLIQTWHNNETHNMRLVSDPWRGTVTPIPHDTSVTVDPDSPVRFNHGSHSLLNLYKRSSDFLVEELRFLRGFIEGRLLSKAALHVEDILPALKTTYSRQPYRAQDIHIMGFARSLTTEEGMVSELRRLMDGLRFAEASIEKRLTVPPKASWWSERGEIVIVIDGEVPIDRVIIQLAPGSPRPNRIAWDSDGDQRLSEQDFAIPFRHVEGGIELAPTWLANRVFVNKKTDMGSSGAFKVLPILIEAVPTLFRLVADTVLTVESVIAANALTAKAITIPNRATGGVTPTRTNKPIVPRYEKAIERWSNVVAIDGVRIVDHPIRIEPGTILRMGPGASLVFRATVKAMGTLAEPVRIVPEMPGEFWGTVALHGPGVEGSVFANAEVEGGSGAVIDNVRYIGMVSVHEASGVEFNNVSFRRNGRFDDMVHVVYSRDVTFRNCLFEGAFADALDVDISEVRVIGCRITGSKNDAIDVMSSRALIQDSVLRASGDKGVSVGEKSNVLIVNSRINENQTGVAVKDASTAYVVNSDLLQNREQVAAFRKNWRYGGGGTVVFDKSFFLTQRTVMKTDKFSEIKIVDSTVLPRFKGGAERLEMDPLSLKTAERRALSPMFAPGVEAALDAWRVTAEPVRRGAAH